MAKVTDVTGMSKTDAAAITAMEDKDDCTKVGFYTGQRHDWNAYNCVLPVNIIGLVSKDDMFVPYSELAMDSGIAGRRILLACVHKTRKEASVIVDMGEGRGCRSNTGLETEVLHPHVARIIREIHGEK